MNAWTPRQSVTRITASLAEGIPINLYCPRLLETNLRIKWSNKCLGIRVPKNWEQKMLVMTQHHTQNNL